MNRDEIIIGGFGGQGVILAGHIMSQAAAIYENRNATLTQDYGPEARGGACAAQVVISGEPISYPFTERPKLVVVMSQEAYTKYLPSLAPGGLLLIDEDLVKPKKTQIKILNVPATRIAGELGRSAVANIVMLGFVAAVSKVITVGALKKSVLASVPKGTEELNTKAFERGYAAGLAKVKTGALK